MKTHEIQIEKSKVAIIVELEENEIKLLEDGEPLTVNLKTTFYNGKKLNEEMEQFFNQVEKEHDLEEQERLTKELERLKEKLKMY